MEIKEQEFFVRVTYIIKWPFPEQHDYVAVMLKNRAQGNFYPIPMLIEKAETIIMVDGKLWKSELYK